MKKTSSLALAAAVCCLVASGALVWRAEAVAVRQPTQPTAVATVNPIKVLEGLEERNAREEQLTREIKTREAQLQQVVDRIKALQADLEMMKRDAPGYLDKRAEFVQLNSQLKSSAQIQQQVLSVLRGEILRDMYVKIAAASKTIAERQGYDAVFLDDSVFQLPEEANDRDIERLILSRTFVYRSEAVDISDQVIALMNNDYRAGGGRTARP